jgi:large subunit ribosomal protein L25
MCLLRDVQRHPYRMQILHVDFQRVDATHKIHQKVPLHFINADIAPGVKLGGGMVSHTMNERRRQVPAGRPADFIEVDLKDLAAGQSIHVSQLVLPKGVEVVHHGEGDPVVASIVMKGGGAVEEAEVAPPRWLPAAPAKPEKKAERVDKR